MTPRFHLSPTVKAALGVCCWVAGTVLLVADLWDRQISDLTAVAISLFAVGVALCILAAIDSHCDRLRRTLWRVADAVRNDQPQDKATDRTLKMVRN